MNWRQTTLRQVAEVFLVIDRSTWRRGVAIFLLILAAGVYYIVSNMEEAESPAGVFLSQSPPPAASQSVIAEATDADGAFQEEAVEAMAGLGFARLYDAFRADRAQGRSRRMEALRVQLEDESLSAAEKEPLRAQWLALANQVETEMKIEGLLVARGLADALVVLSESAAEVLVPKTLDREEAGQIGDLVSRMAGAPLERITIVDGVGARL